eukprot:764999-Hanusia_phi.AAC.3
MDPGARRAMVPSRPRVTRAGAAAGDAGDWSSKAKPETPRLPYVLLFVPVRDPDQTPLALNEEYEKIQASMSLSQATEALTEGESAMVRFFQENGFSKKARALCEELGIEDWNLQDLEYLTEESLDDLTETKLRMHEKKKLWNVISEK